MDSPIVVFIIAVVLISAIYKGTIFLFSLLPDSSFRTFTQSASGKVLVGFLSPIILWLIFVFVAINVLHIQC